MAIVLVVAHLTIQIDQTHDPFTMSLTPESLFKEHFRDTRRQLRALWLKIWGGGFAVVLIGFSLAWFFIQPAPPHTIHMAVGPPEGAYFKFASSYADELAKQGITLHLHTTNGSIDDYESLQNAPDIDLAIVQGGTATAAKLSDHRIEALASLYFEPVWVFYRSEQPYTDLRSLDNKSIAVGRSGSGTAVLSELLLAENGVAPSSGATFVQIGGQEAIRQLEEGAVDAAFFVTAPSADLIRSLVAMPNIRLLNFDRHAAYARRHPYLSTVTLERGVVDLERNYPNSKVHLIAPAANLIANSDLHDALVPLLLRAAKQVHQQEPSLFQRGELPSTRYVEFPVNESARRYFEKGPPLLQKYLPFWVASFVDRGAILLLPAITLLLPLFKVAPPLYRWRIRSRIYRWYKLLRGMESDLQSNGDLDKLRSHWETLQSMETELDDLQNVPLAYMQEFYSLRLHIEFVERRVIRTLRRGDVTASVAGNHPSATFSEQNGETESPQADTEMDELTKTEGTISINSTVSFRNTKTGVNREDPDSTDDDSSTAAAKP